MARRRRLSGSSSRSTRPQVVTSRPWAVEGDLRQSDVPWDLVVTRGDSPRGRRNLVGGDDRRAPDVRRRHERSRAGGSRSHPSGTTTRARRPPAPPPTDRDHPPGRPQPGAHPGKHSALATRAARPGPIAHHTMATPSRAAVREPHLSGMPGRRPPWFARRDDAEWDDMKRLSDVQRIGYGAMRLTGPGIMGRPPTRTRPSGCQQRPSSSASTTSTPATTTGRTSSTT